MKKNDIFDSLAERRTPDVLVKSTDVRNHCERDRGRVIHSAAFRRLQGKTQVMGVGEGDFHRTRLTHSLEVAQIGVGVLNFVREKLAEKYKGLAEILPTRDLIEAACLAHDLGHPPFGHAGEVVLNKCLIDDGGFEGNGQTLRIITKLEKYHECFGLNPTRRFTLSVLKYPVAYSSFEKNEDKPPKCYLDSEKGVVNWALECFPEGDASRFVSVDEKSLKPKFKSLDASIMECADDIAYAVHDLEDVVARGMVLRKELSEKILHLIEGKERGEGYLEQVLKSACDVSVDGFYDELFGSSYLRKRLISKLVHYFISNVRVDLDSDFESGFFAYNVVFEDDVRDFLEALKSSVFELVVSRAAVRQLEVRGKRIVESVYNELILDPERLIPRDAWSLSAGAGVSNARRVCDYISGMTDSYCEKVYRRLFVPGFGSSRDEL